MTAPLHGIRVLEVATGIAGPFAGRLLADHGAEVVKLEPPGGDPSRTEGAVPGPRPEGTGSLFASLSTDKRSVLVDGPRDPVLRELLTGADVLLHSWPEAVLEDAGLGLEERRALQPGLVTVSVTAFGQVGPYSTWSGSDIVAYAMGGPMHATGEPAREPMKLAGHVVEYLCGAGAAFATLAAVATVERGGGPVDVDISTFETQASSIDRRSVLLLSHQFTGAIGYREGGNRMSAIPAGVFPAQDGYVQVVFAPNWMPRVGEMLGDEELDAILHSGNWVDHPDLPEILNAALLGWTLTRTRAECMEQAQQHRLAVMPLNSPTEVLDEPHFAARRSFVEVPHPDGGTFRVPGPSFRMDGVERPCAPPPVLDQHGVAVRAGGWRTRARSAPPAVAAGPGRLPLDGIRVIDLTVVWAGPYCTMHLGDLGADVVRVDNAHLFPTATRGAVPRPAGPASELGQVWGAFPDGDPGRRPWNRAGGFVCHARGKRSLTLDLRRPLGLETMLELVERSDVLVENNSAKVMERLGLGWDVLSARNRRLVEVRMPLLGLSGPYRDHIGFGAHIEALIGLTTLRGYLDSDPSTNDPTYHMDPTSGTVAAFAVLAALRRREATGTGALIELAQAESLLHFLGEYFVDASRGHDEWSALGNRHPHRAPQGVYPCSGGGPLGGHLGGRRPRVAGPGAGDGIAAVGDRARARRRGRAPGPPRRDRPPPRRLDRRRSTAGTSPAGARPRACEAGPVLDEADLLADPHLRERGFFVRTGSEELGEWDFAGHLWRWDGPERRVGPVNQLGHDNEDILRDVLGWDDDRIEALRADGHLHLDYLDAAGNPY